jgi:Kef-type K+ transport system membrane component KefB
MTYSVLLLQLVVILGTARLLGALLRVLGQPPVIGEMTAGIVLGPIVFGALAPRTHAQLFAPESLPALDSLSQLGLVLFMFIVGAELRLPLGLRRQLTAAGCVGIASVVLPMLLGILISPLLYPQLAPPGVAFWPFALFMAAAMSITAFPIMARILKERDLTHSELGRLALTSAAVADVFAWIVLAGVIVIANAQSDWTQLPRMLGGLALLCGIVFGVLRSLLGLLLARYAPTGKPTAAVMSVMLICLFACAAFTKLLHVHAVFGAFLFGACLPRDDRLLATLIERIEYLAVLVLMPIFFALAGLSTTPDAFANTGLAALLLILGAAIIGKVVGGALGARWLGHPWRLALAIGSLMNARALMELIVMKVGLDNGIIGQELFTLLMIMAIVTTFMTTPLLMAFVGKRAVQTV